MTEEQDWAWSLEIIFSLQRRLKDAERTLAGWLRGDGTAELFKSSFGLSGKQTQVHRMNVCICGLTVANKEH